MRIKIKEYDSGAFRNYDYEKVIEALDIYKQIRNTKCYLVADNYVFELSEDKVDELVEKSFQGECLDLTTYKQTKLPL